MKKKSFEELIFLAEQVVKEAEENAAENPTSPEIQVVIVEPLKKPYKKTIPNTLDAMKEIVGGYIENVFIGTTVKGARIGIVLNEEGKIIKLPVNRLIMNYDVFMGNFFITAYNLEGDSISLTDEEAEHFIRKFTPIEVYL